MNLFIRAYHPVLFVTYVPASHEMFKLKAPKIKIKNKMSCFSFPSNLVSIELRLERACFVEACIGGLFICHLSKFGIKMG